MGKNSDKDDFVELGGAEFRRVRNGLDEAQVASCISELVSQRDKFRQHEEHLSSLTKLAEKTVAEADKLAEEIKTEAKDQAKVEASTIITKAEEQAQRIIEEKRTEIINIATEQAEAIKAEAEQEAEAIKTEAEQEAELLLENQRKKIQLELSNLTHQLYSHLLSELENLKQEAAKSEVEFKDKLSQPSEETGTVSVEQDKRHDEFVKLIQTEDRESTSESDWELEILPPIDLTKIMGVVTYLDSLPEVESTEIIPETDRPSIVVFLREPINLTDVMRTLPEVAQVKEDTTDTGGADTKPRKVQIVLKEKTVLDKTKERLNSEVSNILSDPSYPPAS